MNETKNVVLTTYLIHITQRTVYKNLLLLNGRTRLNKT